MFDELVAWVVGQGGILHGIEPALTEEGWRGIVATEDIESEQVILSIPESILLSTRSARSCPDLGPILSRHPTLTDKQVLCLHLLHEMSRKDTSRFRIYLDHLPRSYNLLESWTDDEAERLGVPYAVEDCKEARASLEAEWDECREALREAMPGPALAKWRSKAAWAWASGTVMSRTMYLPGDSVGCLTPLGDFHNYRPPPPPYTGFVSLSLFPESESQGPVTGPPVAPATAASGATAAATTRHRATPPPYNSAQTPAENGDPEAQRSSPSDDAGPAPNSLDARAPGPPAAAASGGQQQPQQQATDDGGGWGDGAYHAESRTYRIVARRPYRRGEQVFLCYGKYTNLELLRTYGFLLEGGNAHDQIPVAIEPCLVAGGAPRHARDWLAAQQTGDLYIAADGEPSWQLLQGLRALTIDPETFRRQHRDFIEGKRFSVEGDIRALQRLQDVVVALLLPLVGPGGATTQREWESKECLGGESSLGVNAQLAEAWRAAYVATLKKCLRLAKERLERILKP